MSIQALREKRAALCAKAGKLLKDHPAEKWNATVAAQVDELHAEIGEVDIEIRDYQRRVDSAFGHAGFSADDEWRDAETGERIPVAYARKGALSAQLNGAFANKGGDAAQISMGAFLRGVAGMRLPEGVRASLTEGTDTAGGFTLPSYLQLKMLDALTPVSSLLTAGAGVAILEEGAKSYRIPAINAIPTAAWRSELGALATSEPTFRSVDLVPRSLSFQFRVSRELLADAAGIDVALFTAIAQAFAAELDRAGLRGTGTAPEIRGILNTSGIQSVANGANGASLNTSIFYANFITAMQSILTANAPMPTAAIMAPRSFATLAGLLDTTNQPRRRPPVLDTWQFVPTSQIPVNLTVGTSNDCTELYVGDFSKVAFFLREGVSIQRLNELYAGTGEIGFACHTRVDLGVLYPAAFAVCTGVRA